MGGAAKGTGQVQRHHCEREPGPWPALYLPHMAKRGQARGSCLNCTPCPCHAPRGPSSRGHMHPHTACLFTSLCSVRITRLPPLHTGQGALCTCPRAPGPQGPLPTPHPDPAPLESLSRYPSLAPAPCPGPVQILPGLPGGTAISSGSLPPSLTGAHVQTEGCTESPPHPGLLPKCSCLSPAPYTPWMQRLVAPWQHGPIGGVAGNADSPEVLEPGPAAVPGRDGQTTNAN